MAFEVGKDVEAMCNTCGDVWHVIVAKVGDRITKVQCKQCNKQHRFKPTGDAPAANLVPPKRTVVGATRVASRGSKAASSRAGAGVRESIGGEIVHDPDKPVRAYAISERFALGDQIQHKKFGPGVVLAVEDDKVRVNFRDGLKVLLHGRS